MTVTSLLGTNGPIPYQSALFFQDDDDDDDDDDVDVPFLSRWDMCPKLPGVKDII